MSQGCLLVSASQPTSHQSSCYPPASLLSSLELFSVALGFCFLAVSGSSSSQRAPGPFQALAPPRGPLSLRHPQFGSLVGPAYLGKASYTRSRCGPVTSKGPVTLGPLSMAGDLQLPTHGEMFPFEDAGGVSRYHHVQGDHRVMQTSGANPAHIAMRSEAWRRAVQGC